MKNTPYIKDNEIKSASEQKLQYGGRVDIEYAKDQWFQIVLAHIRKDEVSGSAIEADSIENIFKGTTSTKGRIL